MILLPETREVVSSNVVLGYLFSIILALTSSTDLPAQALVGIIIDCSNKRPVENVNLTFKQTSAGTTTDNSGIFKINYGPSIKTNELIITHVAYYEKTIVLNRNVNRDTLHICLEPRSINLNEATITANKKQVFGQRNYSVLDFNFIDDNVLLLVFDYWNNSKELIYTTPIFDTICRLTNDSLNKATQIYKDCLGQCHLLCKNTAYQIDYIDSVLTINYPIAIDTFYKIVGNCLFESSDYLVFKSTSEEGFSNTFYAVNEKDHTSKFIYSAFQAQLLKNRDSQIVWILSHPEFYPHPENDIRFEKEIMFKPSVVSMHKVGDSIYLFDYSDDSTYVFSYTLDPVRSFKVKDNSNEKWNGNILIDPLASKAYTTIEENNLETLFGIDLVNGRLQREVVIPYVFPYKIAVNDGFLYVLYKESENPPVSKRIYRYKL
jgi:hypothetical protein